jgi:hypothetical protein
MITVTLIRDFAQKRWLPLVGQQLNRDLTAIALTPRLAKSHAFGRHHSLWKCCGKMAKCHPDSQRLK